MLSTSFTAFRKAPASYFDHVIENNETLIVNRGKDPAYVVLSIDDYISMVEACHGDTSDLIELLDRQELSYKFKNESQLVSEESMKILHEFDAIENPK